jgi:hypothetical protein
VTGGELAARVVERCALLGLAVHVEPPGAEGWQGFPTLVVAGACGLLFAVCKDDDSPLTAAERDWRDALAAAGAEFHVWRPEDLDHSSVAAILGRRRAHPS